MDIDIETVLVTRGRDGERRRHRRSQITWDDGSAARGLA